MGLSTIEAASVTYRALMCATSEGAATLAPNTTAIRRPFGNETIIEIRLHGNLIAEIYPDEDVCIGHAGYISHLTTQRLGEILAPYAPTLRVIKRGNGIYLAETCKRPLLWAIDRNPFSTWIRAETGDVLNGVGALKSPANRP